MLARNHPDGTLSSDDALCYGNAESFGDDAVADKKCGGVLRGWQALTSARHFPTRGFISHHDAGA
jgi:hypothetical protein